MSLKNINIKTIINPKEKDLEKFRQFSKTNWGPSSETEESEQLRFFDRPYSVIVAYDDRNKILGLLNIHLKEINYENIKFKLGGVGGVVIHAGYRHQGIATKLLYHAINTMKDLSIDISMLCTDIPKLGKLYSRVGYKPLDRSYYFYNKLGRKEKDDSGMIRAISSPKIVKYIMNSKSELNVGKSNF